MMASVDTSKSARSFMIKSISSGAASGSGNGKARFGIREEGVRDLVGNRETQSSAGSERVVLDHSTAFVEGNPCVRERVPRDDLVAENSRKRQWVERWSSPTLSGRIESHASRVVNDGLDGVLVVRESADGGIGPHVARAADTTTEIDQESRRPSPHRPSRSHGADRCSCTFAAQRPDSPARWALFLLLTASRLRIKSKLPKLTFRHSQG